MLGLTVERGSVPAVRQLCEQLRHLIGSGQLPAGTKLPSTRQLAAGLGIARNTAIDAYEQLVAEGFLESRVGAGTFVAEGAGYLADAAATKEAGGGAGAGAAGRAAADGGWTVSGAVGADHTGSADGTSGGEDEAGSLVGAGGADSSGSVVETVSAFGTSGAGRAIDAVGLTGSAVIDFTAGSPDLALFPRRAWGNHLRNAALDAPDRVFGYGDAFGDPVLRRELAAYLFRAKGIRTEPERITVVNGSSEGFLLIAHALAGRFHTVAVEDPTVEFGRDIFARCGYRLRPVDVDGQGIRTDRLKRLADGELVLLTPSHQFPTGSILSIQRRRRLAEMAERADSYLIEDDYDSEFRFRGSPVPPLHMLAPERVIHVGTFSKTLSPGLRLGFLVLPRALVGVFRETKEALNLLTPAVEQRALAGMLAGGDFERHLYRMVKVYRQKRAALTAALDDHFAGAVEMAGDTAGMHLLARFRLRRPVHWEEAASYGVRIQCADDYRLAGGGERREAVFGYGHLSAADIREGVRRLAAFLAGRIGT